MFTKFTLDFDTNLFDELSTSTKFENIVGGRLGANLVNFTNGIVSLVRTTTNYNEANQMLLPVHYAIIEKIKRMTKYHKLEFNNAMIEIYDSTYRNMKFHSDQSLDLVEDSYICIFSCYADPLPKDIRKLKVKKKDTEESMDFLMEHNSIILFPVSINQKYLHKIVLETTNSTSKWLGITFRMSKTFIKFVDEIPYFFPSDTILRVGNDDERKAFLKYKGMENSLSEYVYPIIDYTISFGDILPIKKFK